MLKGIDATDVYSSREIVSVDVSDTERIVAQIGEKTLLKVDGNHIEREMARLKTVAKLLNKSNVYVFFIKRGRKGGLNMLIFLSTKELSSNYFKGR